MGIFLEERAGGEFALYIDGDLQFDTLDEALYHEALALPALCMARQARDRSESLRVLICGGGDGLALREVLRFPNVGSVDLVDYSEEVVALGKERLADRNERAFYDPRVTTVIADAWEFVSDARQRSAPYDVILCDFSVPRRLGDARVYTQEWFTLLRGALSPKGIIAVNGFSPQQTAEAFWSLQNTIRAAGLDSLPFRVCLPTFRAHGYGIWSFTLCGVGMKRSHFRHLDCPVATRQANLETLWRGARFTRSEWALAAKAPVHTLREDVLLPLLLNPGPRGHRPNGVEMAGADAPYDLNRLIQAIPVLHPYHTRAMVETLAQQVAGTVQAIDIRRLVEALHRRAARLPAQLREEIGRLRQFLSDQFAVLDQWMSWSYRLFAILVLIMTVANAVAPDTAFAKGGEGHGGSFHGSMMGESEFGGASAESVHVTGEGFRGRSNESEVTDITGRTYRPQFFRYRPLRVYGGGGGGGYFQTGSRNALAGSAPLPNVAEHRAAFVADTNLFVLDNGDIAVTLSNKTYFLINGGGVALMYKDAVAPLSPLYPDPGLLQSIATELRGEQQVTAHEIAARTEWLHWVGWTQSFVPAVQHDASEIVSLRDLSRRLQLAISSLGPAATGNAVENPPARGNVRLAESIELDASGNVTLRQPDGGYLVTNGRLIWNAANPNSPLAPPPFLLPAITELIDRRYTETIADLQSGLRDIRQLQYEHKTLESDLVQYNAIYARNGNDPSYSVDYGTDEIAVSDALSRTNQDIATNGRDLDEANRDHDRLDAESQTLFRAKGIYDSAR